MSTLLRRRRLGLQAAIGGGPFKACAEVVQVRDECAELALFDAQDVHRLSAADRGIARQAAQKGHLAEVLTGTELGEHALGAVRAVAADHLGAARDDDVDAVAQVALLEDALARLEVLLVDA